MTEHQDSTPQGIEHDPDDARYETPDGRWNGMTFAEYRAKSREVMATNRRVEGALREQRDLAVRRLRKLADGLGIDWVEDPVLSTEWADRVE